MIVFIIMLPAREVESQKVGLQRARNLQSNNCFNEKYRNNIYLKRFPKNAETQYRSRL